MFALDGERFWVKAVLPLPVHAAPEPLVFGVWVEVEPAQLETMSDAWNRGTIHERRYRGTLDMIVWPYRNALGLAVELEYGAPEDRPLAHVLGAEHELALDQRDGITLDRVRELAERIAHMEQDLAALEGA